MMSYLFFVSSERERIFRKSRRRMEEDDDGGGDLARWAGSIGSRSAECVCLERSLGGPYKRLGVS